MSILFIADLHLQNVNDASYQRFEKFLKSKARHARALYILGDLFEYYLGDDVQSDLYQQVATAIEELVCQYQTACYFMAGNRDFLLGQNFCEHLHLLNDPYCLQLDEHKIILTHADALCTDDIAYQKIRQQLRDKKWQQGFLAQSIENRIAFAKDARKQSQKHTQSASEYIMDVNQHALMALFQQENCRTMLHGHTHRPAFHQFSHNNKDYLRMVLGDWHRQISYIEYRNQHFSLQTC